MDTERFLTEYEVADLLSVDVTTLRRWRREHTGPPYLRLGTCVRYDPIDLAAYIEAARVNHQTPNQRV